MNAGPSADELTEWLVSTEGEAALLAADLRAFVKAAWPLIEPATPLEWNWHLDAYCLHLQAVTEGRIHKLLINVPPGMAKSSIVSVLWPCWVWAREPHKRFLFCSHKEALALRDAVRRRYVITSDWYRARWPIALAGDANLKSEFHNAAKGYMVALGRGGSTGYRGDYLVMDDPNDATEMESEVQRESTLMWVDQQWSTRGNAEWREVVIQQRTHERDVTGHLEKQGGWTKLKIPMEYAGEPNVTPIGYRDPRSKAGELMFQALFPPERVAEMKLRLGSYGYAGQAQQDPSPRAGGMIQLGWIRKYDRDDEGNLVLEDFRFHPRNAIRFGIVDFAYTLKELDKADPDYTVISAWAVFQSTRGPILCLVDLLRERMEGPEHDKLIAAWSRTHQWAVVGVESVQAQLRGVQELRKLGVPVREMSNKADALYRLDKEKAARALAATPMMEAGRFYVPRYAVWLGEYLDELTRFPRAAHDDQVDVTSAACAIAAKIAGHLGYPLNGNAAGPSTGQQGIDGDRVAREQLDEPAPPTLHNVMREMRGGRDGV